MDIQITSVTKVDDGIQVFARAWDANGDQIGFGKDGSIDLERFIVHNPPLLVPDAIGTITITSTSSIDGFVTTHHYREDPTEALFQALSHVIAVKKLKVLHSKNIIAGKEGHTTSFFYPDAVPSTSLDGSVFDVDTVGGTNWATLVASAGTNAEENDNVAVYIRSGTTSGKWRTIFRYILLFDTSTLPDTDTIASATLSVAGGAKEDGNSITPNINVYSSAPASNTTLAAGDFDSLGSTAFSTAITYASFDVSGTVYNNFPLNASGLAAISATGVSKYGLRNANYDVAGSPPTWTSGAVNSDIRVINAETGGVSTGPVLVVEHTAAGGGGAAPKKQSVFNLD